MRRQYRLSAPRRLINALVKPLAELGLAGRHTYILTVRGRKSGRRYTTPVRLIENGGRWLVAPYGAVGWVRNARAAGTVELKRGRRVERCRIQEATPQEAGPVLQSYVKAVPIVLPFFHARLGSEVEEFVAEAQHHPVFRLIDRDEGDR